MITFFKQNKHRIVQFLKLTLYSGLVFFFTLVIALSAIAWFYRDNIKEHFVAQINSGLQTEVFIEDISVNVFRNFPLAAISLRNVTMLEATNAPVKDTLLTASRVYFQFSIIDIIRKNYSVRKAEVIDGYMHMKILADGTNNYTFWKKQPGKTATKGELEFQLNKVVLSKMNYQFSDYRSNHFLSFSIVKTTVGGNFARNNYLLHLNGEMLVDKIIVDDAFMLGDQRMIFDMQTDVVNNNVFTFRQGNFTLGSHAFVASGDIDLSGDDPFLDLKIAANDLKLENFISDLPPQYANYFQGYRSRGEFFFDASVKGTFSKIVKPYVRADFGISEGELYHRKANLKFENLSFNASFNNGEFRNLSSTALIIKNFTAILNKGEIKGDVSIFNFEEPRLEFQLFSNINADEWQRFLQWDKIKQASGDLLIDIEFKGKLDKNKKFTAYHFMASQVRGVVSASNITFRLKDDLLQYQNINADFLFNNNDVVVNGFSGKASSSDFEMKGYFRNVLPWLFLDNERLFVDASLRADNLNFNELLQHSVSESDTTYRLSLSDKIDFQLQADIGKLAFRKFDGEKVKGTLSMREKVFYASNISLAAMNGTISASGYINGKNDNYLIMGCEAKITDVDVHELFYQMGNFGQQSISHENIKGRITADARFVSRWSPSLDIDWNALETTADIKVENGELINYKPMLALSRYIRVGDLNRVRFSTLENQIQIKNQTIIIPDMEINSDAINIKLSGEHSFNNEINYRLQVLLSDLLARKNRESRNPQEQYGDIIDDGLGRTTLFLLVAGTIDDPVFRYDRQGLREKLKEDFRAERQNLREVFRSEFGRSRNDTLPDGTLAEPSERQQEQKEIEKREKGKFIIEWDDE